MYHYAFRRGDSRYDQYTTVCLLADKRLATIDT
jgi:hypothetical protein